MNKKDFSASLQSRKAGEEETLRRELKRFKRNGCLVCLDGVPSPAEHIVTACLREKGAYMRDYVSDEEKKIRTVNFVRIRK